MQQAQLGTYTAADFQKVAATSQFDVRVQVRFEQFGLPQQSILLDFGEGVDVLGFSHALARLHTQSAPTDSKPRRCASTKSSPRS